MPRSDLPAITCLRHREYPYWEIERTYCVVHVEDNEFACSELRQASIRRAIIEQRLNRVVIGVSSPRLHQLTLGRTVASTGLKPYLGKGGNIDI